MSQHTHAAEPQRAPTRGGRTRIPVADVSNAFATMFAAVTLSLLLAYVFATEVRGWLAARDGLIVRATAVTLTLAIIVTAWAFRRSSSDSRLRLLLPIVAGLLLLQNVRFGADLLGYPLPTLSGVEVGSLADLRDVVSIWAERLGLGPVTGLLILLVVATLTTVGVRWAMGWARNHVLVTEVGVVICLVTALGLSAAVPILGFFGEGSGAWFVTAMVGFAAAGLLVVAGLVAADHRRTAAGWRRRILPWVSEVHPLAGIPTNQPE